MKILCNRIAFTRAIANVAAPTMGGPMQEDQRKAMFAKMSRGGGGGSRGGGGRSSGGNDRKVGGGMVVAKAPIESVPGHGSGSIQVPSVPVFRKPNPDPNWGPKDGRGNTIKPPEGSHWETRDGKNFYPVPDDPRLIMHPMSESPGAGSPADSNLPPPTTVNPAGQVSLPMSGALTPEILRAAGGLSFQQNLDVRPNPSSLPEVKDGPVSFPEMSRFANDALNAVNGNWEYPDNAKKYFGQLLQHYGNPTDAQVQRALQLTDDAFDIGRGRAFVRSALTQRVMWIFRHS
ncbi:MAG TPA: hypothetical protein DCZ95_19695 [Verrucomicrobia bacterium]|nr:MAG: hypothetical protein A2X46_10920 [Lentisphaerae bacterium GWF2_57_35]HBA86310.1 hypothetical protein [Verrucomicrobiota bacterium]